MTSPYTANALKAAAVRASDAALAQRLDDLAARLRQEAAQCPPKRKKLWLLLIYYADKLQGAAAGVRAVGAGEGR